MRNYTEMATFLQNVKLKVYLVGGCGEGEGLLEGVPHVEAQLEILLHVLQRLVGREPAVYDGPAWGGQTVLLKFIMICFKRIQVRVYYR